MEGDFWKGLYGKGFVWKELCGGGCVGKGLCAVCGGISVDVGVWTGPCVDGAVPLSMPISRQGRLFISFRNPPPIDRYQPSAAMPL